MADVVEIMARAIAETDGQHPDDLAPWTTMTGPKGESVPWWRVFQEQVEAALSALDAAGYAVVPKEPTVAMIEAAPDQFKEAKHFYGTGHHAIMPCLGADAASIYRAMIAASSQY